MSALLDLILDTNPANDDVGVPLLSTVSIKLSGLNYDTTSLEEGIYLEGPDTDQYIGPGLVDLTNPDNVSQGELDDFLQSPGYKGIVNGTVVVSNDGVDTTVTFTSDKAMYPLLEYIVGLTGVYESDGITEIEGFVSFKFTTGTGSIETIPATTSTSILSATVLPDIGLSTSVPLAIVSSTPEDLDIEVDPGLTEIVIEFNKDIDPASVTSDTISVLAEVVSVHPCLKASAAGELGKTITVEGNKIKVKI